MDLSRKQIIEYSKKYDAKHRGTPDELVEKKLKNWAVGIDKNLVKI